MGTIACFIINLAVLYSCSLVVHGNKVSDHRVMECLIVIDLAFGFFFGCIHHALLVCVLWKLVLLVADLYMV